jgi:hypothetical protein
MEDGCLEYILEFMMEVKYSPDLELNSKFQIITNDQFSNRYSLSK